MTTNGDPAKLADLITQAADEDPEQPRRPRRKGILSRLWACVRGDCRDGPSLPKLASVLPTCDVQVPLPPEPSKGCEELAKTGPVPLGKPSVPNGCCWGPRGDEPPQLGPQVGVNIGRKTLVLDLDETLVHSSFRQTTSAQITISVELEGEQHQVFVRKRPGVDEFLIQVARMYEVVVYTASLSKYANPLLDQLDSSGAVAYRLFREACTRSRNGYMKDLSRLGRDLRSVIIIDNSAVCYFLQPDNAIPIRTWKEDPSDTELIDLIPILRSLLQVDDIPEVLRQTVWGTD